MVVTAATIGRRVTVTTLYLLLFLLILNTLPTISLPSSQEQKEGIDYYDEENTISTTGQQQLQRALLLMKTRMIMWTRRLQKTLYYLLILIHFIKNDKDFF